MKLGLGILVLYLTVYTAKSLYVDDGSNNINNLHGTKEQQQKSDLLLGSIGIPEIKINLLPTSTSSTIINKLIPQQQQLQSHEEEIKDETLSAFKHLPRYFPSLDDLKLPFYGKIPESDEISNDISKADIIEIEVPIIGSEYVNNLHNNEQILSEENSNDQDYAENNPEGYVEINILPSTTATDPPESVTDKTEPITYNTDFQNPTDGETTLKIDLETTSSPHIIKNAPAYNTIMNINDDDMHTIESKLMDQWVDSPQHDNMIDDVEYQREIYAEQPNYYRQHNQLEYPFNVKIVVNNKDPKVSCKNKRSCHQVNFSKNRDIDHHHHQIPIEYFMNDSNEYEDLFFKSEPEVYYEKRNQLKSRRAADDRFLSDAFSLTPAPLNYLRGLRKPSFIERLENESSLERSARINKDLNNLMKFVSVWAHVDKFITDRARSAIRKIAYLDDYDDMSVLGSRRKHDNDLRAAAKAVDDPFT